MLKIELERLADLQSIEMVGSSDQAFCSYHKQLQEISDCIRFTWRQAICSDLPDHTLKRYFTYYLAQLCAMADQGISKPVNHDLVSAKCTDFRTNLGSLISELLSDYQEYADLRTLPPEYWRQQFAEKYDECANHLINKIANSALDTALKNSISDYLLIRSSNTTVDKTFAGLFYYKSLITELCKLDFSDQNISHELTNEMIRLNFNSLHFLNYLQDKAIIALNAASTPELLASYYLKERLFLSWFPTTYSFAAYPDWPAIVTMYSGWLGEEVLLRQKQVTTLPQVAPTSNYRKIVLIPRLHTWLL